MSEGAAEFGLEEMGPDNYRCEVVITYAEGLHVRPCTEFAALALTFESDIHVHFGNLHVDGKAPMDLLTLAAGAGAHLILEARGRDARKALAALVGLVHSGFPEGKAAS